jgi:hypothetical protein
MRAALVRITRSVIVVFAATLALVAPVAAGEPVDPNTLNPPPNPAFNPVCERLGAGIVCDIAFSDPPLVDEPSDLFCDGDQILISQDRAVVGKRFYDADGNLLRRHFHEDYVGNFTNPSSGRTVDWVSHATISQVLTAPGDITSGQATSAGLSIRIWGSDGGAVLIDAGRVVVDEATGDILSSAGPHHFDDYFVNGDIAALQPICDALA